MGVDNKYSKTAIFLHWIIAFLLIVNFALGWLADFLPEDWIRFSINTHKSIGISILGLVLMRILWRLSHQPPAIPNSFKAWERALSHAVHVLLYGLMLLIPISGWMHDSAWKDAATHPMQLFYTIPWPRIAYIQNLEPALKERLHDIFGAVHEWMSIALALLFVLHIAGVVKHHWLDKNSVLPRMLP
jgi:cytochrome b561